MANLSLGRAITLAMETVRAALIESMILGRVDVEFYHTDFHTNGSEKDNKDCRNVRVSGAVTYRNGPRDVEIPFTADVMVSVLDGGWRIAIGNLWVVDCRDEQRRLYFQRMANGELEIQEIAPTVDA